MFWTPPWTKILNCVPANSILWRRLYVIRYSLAVGQSSVTNYNVY